VQGYVTGRRGANATLIGPCIATPDAGPILLADACGGVPGTRVIDVPQDNTRASKSSPRAD